MGEYPYGKYWDRVSGETTPYPPKFRGVQVMTVIMVTTCEHDDTGCAREVKWYHDARGKLLFVDDPIAGKN